jgi:hypothetical protein
MTPLGMEKTAVHWSLPPAFASLRSNGFVAGLSRGVPVGLANKGPRQVRQIGQILPAIPQTISNFRGLLARKRVFTRGRLRYNAVFGQPGDPVREMSLFRE